MADADLSLQSDLFQLDTVAREGDGKTGLCARPGCLNSIRGKRFDAKWCSDRCREILRTINRRNNRRKIRICVFPGCDVDISDTQGNRKYCYEHNLELTPEYKERKRQYNLNRYYYGISKEYMQEYNRTEKAKETKRKYLISDRYRNIDRMRRHRADRKEWMKNYVRTPEYRQACKAYRDTLEYKEWKDNYKLTPQYKENNRRQNSSLTARARRQTQEYKEYMRAYGVKHKFGFSLDDIPSQPEKCENTCCSGTKPVIDHDHNSGQFRGWICNKCNFAIGLADDNPSKFRWLANYLDVSNKVAEHEAAIIVQKGRSIERVHNKHFIHPMPFICENEFCTNDRVVLDHCHLTGKFRGWICAKCNSVLGLTGDNPDILRWIAVYLESRRMI